MMFLQHVAVEFYCVWRAPTSTSRKPPVSVCKDCAGELVDIEQPAPCSYRLESSVIFTAQGARICPNARAAYHRLSGRHGKSAQWNTASLEDCVLGEWSEWSSPRCEAGNVGLTADYRIVCSVCASICNVRAFALEVAELPLRATSVESRARGKGLSTCGLGFWV